MPVNGGERAGLLVMLFLVIVSMFLEVVNTSPKGNSILLDKHWTWSNENCQWTTNFWPWEMFKQ